MLVITKQLCKVNKYKSFDAAEIFRQDNVKTIFDIFIPFFPLTHFGYFGIGQDLTLYDNWFTPVTEVLLLDEVIPPGGLQDGGI